MRIDEERKKTVKEWFSGLAADFYDTGKHKLVTRYGKCLNLYRDYVDKLLKVCSNDSNF
jgi:hypothetical protein